MAVRARDRRESECCSVMGQISVASVLSTYRLHHRPRKRADFPVVLHTRELD
jgi:hypothetical protein